MPEPIEADPDAIRGMVDELSEASEAIALDLDSLTSELDWLMNAWSGEAAEAYRTAQSGWTGSMTEMRATLGTAIGVLSSIATRYEETELAVIRECG